MTIGSTFHFQGSVWNKLNYVERSIHEHTSLILQTRKIRYSMICLTAITAYLCKSRPETQVSWLLLNSFSLCQATSSMSHPPVQDRFFTLSSKSNSNGLHSNLLIITKLDQKFSSNCFFYYSGNSGSVTINVLLTTFYKTPTFPEIFCTLLGCLRASIFNAQWHKEKPAVFSRRTLHEPKASDSHSKLLAYLLGF